DRWWDEPPDRSAPSGDKESDRWWDELEGKKHRR
ncbi:membrane protein, partial [Streptomyces varsoviensis]